MTKPGVSTTREYTEPLSAHGATKGMLLSEVAGAAAEAGAAAGAAAAEGAAAAGAAAGAAALALVVVRAKPTSRASRLKEWLERSACWPRCAAEPPATCSSERRSLSCRQPAWAWEHGMLSCSDGALRRKEPCSAAGAGPASRRGCSISWAGCAAWLGLGLGLGLELGLELGLGLWCALQG